MEMSPKQSTLVLLTVAVAVMVISAQITVILDEKETIREDVPFGSSLTLYCPLRREKLERFRVSWYLNPSGSSFNDTHRIITEVVNKSTKTSTDPSNKTKQNLRDDTEETEETLLKYSLSNVTYKDSGWYFCEVTVEIPFFEVIRSQGAEVVIMKAATEHTTYQSQVSVSPTNPPLLDEWWMWIVLGVSSLVLIVLLIICVLLRRRLRGSRDSECPIYANMRPTVNSQPSPRPGMQADNLKMVSSQNLRTPSPARTYDQGKRRHKQ